MAFEALLFCAVFDATLGVAVAADLAGAAVGDLLSRSEVALTLAGTLAGAFLVAACFVKGLPSSPAGFFVGVFRVAALLLLLDPAKFPLPIKFSDGRLNPRMPFQPIAHKCM